MKELTIEQKAEAYDKALDRAKKWYNAPNIDKMPTYGNRIIEEIFPELIKYNDEKVRGAIIHFISHTPTVPKGRIDKKTMLTWLEKQKTSEEAIQYLKENHSPSEVSDFQTAMNIAVAKAYDKGVKDGLENRGQTFTKKEVDDAYLAGVRDTKQEFEKQCGQKPAWSEEDEKMFDKIIGVISQCYFGRKPKVTMDDIDWLKSLKDRVQPQPMQEWKQENTGDLTDFENVMMHIGNSFFGKNAGLNPNDTNAIKEQANLLMGIAPKQDLKGKLVLTPEAYERILKSNGQKSAWSEEDNKIIEEIINDIEYARAINYHAPKEGYEFRENWLKSLRPQNWTKEDKERYISCLQRLGTGNPEQPETINSKWFKEHVYPQNRWKPSNEQIKVLQELCKYSEVANLTEKGVEILKSMYNDIEKLTE